MKFRPAQDRLIEVDADRSRDPPRGRRLLARRRSRQCGVAGETEGRQSLPPGRLRARRQIRRQASSAPASTATRSGVPSGPGFSEASLKTTGTLSGPENWPLRCERTVEGRRGGVDLDAGDFRRRSVGCADDPHPPVLHGQAVKPGRMKTGHPQGRQLKRAVRTAREGQNGLLEANFREPDVAARQLDERKLQPRRAERQLRPVGPWRADQTFAHREIGRRQELRSSIGPVRETFAPVIALSCASISPRCADQSMRYGATSATDITATSATAMMVRTVRTVETTSTPPRRTAAATIRRASRFKMPRKYDHDNKSGARRHRARRAARSSERSLA